MAYRYIDTTQAASELARLHKKPVLYISFSWEKSWEELFKAAPYLERGFRDIQQHDDNNPAQCLMEGQAIIVCDTDEERDNLFSLTVGDDGPTQANPYAGPARVYALTISADGESLNENT